jgi:MFS family permease
MSEQVRPDEAARALAEIRQRQQQVVDLAMPPAWYWWIVAALVVGLSATVDAARHRPGVITFAAVAFTLGIGAVTVWVVLGAWQRAQWRNQLLGSRAGLAIVGFVGLVVGTTLGVAFALHAAGVRPAATLAGLLAAALLVAGGPVLTRILRHIMVDNQARGR